MRDMLKKTARALIVPLALVGHAACQRIIAIQPDRGSSPWTGKVMCNIEKPSGRHCASADEVATGIRLAAAAEALSTGQTSTIGIDDSPAALGRCNGTPEAVQFEGPFPQGSALCLNCAVVTASNDVDELCVELCQMETDPDHFPATSAVRADCQSRAHAATDFGSVACLASACTDSFHPIETFVDPMRSPEPVDWQNLIGVSVAGDVLVRTAPTTNNFDAGAASSQAIPSGDAYVQFTAVEVNTSRLCGLSNGGPPDTDPTFENISFAIDLFKDGHYYVFEQGTKIAGPDLNGAFGAYVAGDTFRVHVKDNFDGTGTVRYSLLTASCTDGSVCPETVFFNSTTKAQYPMRVDSSFREANGTLSHARLVRLQ
jgi:hypothetical protein